MTKFIAYVKQEMQGCDYTIACGQTIWKLKSTSKEDAIEELRKMIIGEYVPGDGYEEGYWGESKLSEVILFEVKEELPIDVNQWYREALKFKNDEENKAKNDDERKEYERLKSKYGNLL